METQSKPLTWKSTISGILILPALVFIATPIKFVYVLFSLVTSMRYLNALNIFILFMDIVLLSLTVLLAYLYFTRKKITPSFYIVLRILYFIFVTFVYIVSLDMFITQSSQFQIVLEFLGGIAGLLIFIPVLVYPKKIQRVFTEKCSDLNAIERIVSKIEPVSDGFYNFLVRLKYFLIPVVLGFILFTIIVTIVITAIF